MRSFQHFLELYLVKPLLQPTSLGDALAAALAATTLNGAVSSGKKKGKRGKALLLGGPPRPML